MHASTPDWMKFVEQWLWERDHPGQPFWSHYFWHFCRVVFAVIRDVVTGQITLHAMSLVYTTLLSLVPLLALSFSVLKGLGAHNELEPVLRSFVEPLGAQGDEIVSNLLVFVDNIKVGVLGSVGLGVLVYTVISLVQKIERSFNEIWRVSHSRSLAQRFSNYISVIVVGPVLVVSAIGATATLVGSDVVRELLMIQPFGWLYSLATRLMPYVLIICLFTFVYMFIPNTRVRLKHALVGGVTAGVAWQSAVYGFTHFVAGSNNYEAIYSGFAVGILALIWLYVAWLILLMGAAVAFYSQHGAQIARERHIEPCARGDEMAGLAIMYSVVRHFDQEGGGLEVSELESSLGFGPEVSRRQVDRLLAARILSLCGEEADHIQPGRAPDKCTLGELLHVLRSPDIGQPEPTTDIAAVMQLMQGHDALLQKHYAGITLQDWVRQTAGHQLEDFGTALPERLTSLDPVSETTPSS